MTGTIDREWTPADAARFGAVWGRLGWIGFFLQIALLAVPIFLTIYILSFALGGANFGIGRFLTYASLVLMAFTTFWFYRYTVLAGRLRDGDGSVDVPQIFSTLWIGLWASCAGIALSVVLLLGEVIGILFALLGNPQIGLLVAPSGAENIRTISAMDAVSLASQMTVLAAELAVFAMTLWLIMKLYRGGARSSGQTSTVA